MNVNKFDSGQQAVAELIVHLFSKLTNENPCCLSNRFLISDFLILL